MVDHNSYLSSRKNFSWPEIKNFKCQISSGRVFYREINQSSTYTHELKCPDKTKISGNFSRKIYFFIPGHLRSIQKHTIVVVVQLCAAHLWRRGWDFSHFISSSLIPSSEGRTSPSLPWLCLSFMRMLIRMLRWETRQVPSLSSLLCILVFMMHFRYHTQLLWSRFKHPPPYKWGQNYKDETETLEFFSCERIENSLLSNHNSFLQHSLQIIIFLWTLPLLTSFDSLPLIFLHQVGERMK